ncbi:hypothetical protein [Shewanella sp.]|uniref:hypothetical protein n=1 Tax=Shewanella sp. TaxID=50422 RepID=UPI004047744E
MTTFPYNRWEDKSISINDISDVDSDLTLNKSLIRKDNGFQQYEFEGTTLFQSQKEAKSLYAYLASKSGSFESFKVQIPLGLQMLDNTHPTKVNVKEETKAGETSIMLVPSSQIEAGTYFNFSNHNKMYMVVSHNITTNTLVIRPELRVDVNATTFVDFNAYIYGYQKSNELSREPHTANYQKFKLKIIEDV